jgi:hypothetical protein
MEAISATVFVSILTLKTNPKPHTTAMKKDYLQ